MKILIACPTYKGKDYALRQYLNAYLNFDYDQKELFMVDNSEGLDYWQKLSDIGIPCVHIDRTGLDFTQIMNRSWEAIIKYALENDFKYVFSCEADNINPPNTLKDLWLIAGIHHASIVAHDYPDIVNDGHIEDWISALGCTLIETSFLSEITLPLSNEFAFETILYKEARRLKKKIILLSNFIETDHIKEVEVNG